MPCNVKKTYPLRYNVSFTGKQSFDIAFKVSSVKGKVRISQSNLSMRTTIFLSLLVSWINLSAQNNTVSVGGEANGSGGSVSYSVGQIACASISASNGSLNQGVQHPYEILVITSINDIMIDLKAHIYPNPSNHQLILTISTEEFISLRYMLLNFQGNVLKTERIINSKTILDLSNLSSGSYILRVLSKNKEIKSFKVIKTK